MNYFEHLKVLDHVGYIVDIKCFHPEIRCNDSFFRKIYDNFEGCV